MRKGNPRVKYDCNRCGFTYKKVALKKQRGMLLCSDCYDTTLEIKPLIMKWRSPRLPVDPLAAVTSPIIYFLTADVGVSYIGQSHECTREGNRNSFVMHVAGRGQRVDITASPRIVAGTNERLLTLVGTSDVYPVQLATGNGLDLQGTIALSNGVQLSLAYSTADGLWHETSRSNAGPIWWTTAITYYLLSENGSKILLESNDAILGG